MNYNRSVIYSYFLSDEYFTIYQRGVVMSVKELRQKAKMTQKQFSEYFNIPRRTIEDWEVEKRQAPQYVYDLIEYKLIKENLIKEDL